MKKQQQFLCFLIVMYPLKISCLLYAFLTDYWVETDGYHFGLFKYCVDNTTTCLDVTPQLQTIEDHILVTRYCLISACVLVFVCLVFCVSLCSECSDRLMKKKMHVSVNVTGTFFQFLLETCTVFTFVLGVTDHELLRVSQLSWSFYITSSTTGFTLLFLFILLHTTLYCNRSSYLATVGDSLGTKLTFQNPPQSVSVDAGRTVSIVAYVRNANRVHWCKGRDPVVGISTSFEERFNNSHKAELTLKNARLEDNGEYTCVAEKYGKKRKEIRESFFIYVHHVKPVFNTKPKDVTVHLGEDLNLEAIVENAETVSWLLEDQILSNSNSKRKLTLKFLNGKLKASLKIDCVTKNDEGDYTCLAKSGNDPIKAKEEYVYCHVSVIDAELPSFNNVPKSLNIKSGSTLEIAIKVCGYPKPKNVCWFKDGTVIERSRRVIMQYIEGDSRLLIHDTVPADSGMYECYAENVHGNNRCKIPVNVTKEDQEPISCTHVLLGVY